MTLINPVMRTVFCILLATFLPVADIKAQVLKTANILVVDQKTGEPLPFANIYLKESANGTCANAEGLATIRLGAADTARVSYIGYETQAVPINENLKIRVELISSVNRLEEVDVTYQRIPSAKNIIKKALKNVDENYSDRDLILKTFYRETVLENDRHIQLNEAYSDIYYTSYPQKKLDRKIWMDWYYDDSYAFDLEANMVFDELLHDFNTKHDQMIIKQARSSATWSQFGIAPALMGGPLGLTGYDKVKYFYDFLDHRNFGDYQYEHLGFESINGATCYVIRFRPKSLTKRFVSDQSRKTNQAIYAGNIYIETERFAVTKMDYRLVADRDYGFFQLRMPLEYKVEVAYKKHGDSWYLDKITSSEMRSWRLKKNKSVRLQGIRELFVIEIDTTNVKPCEDSLIFKSTRLSAVRCIPMEYDSILWSASDPTEKWPYQSGLLENLSQEIALEQQFKTRYLSADQLPAPIAPKKDSIRLFAHGNQHDPYAWMANPSYESTLLKYLSSENNYAKNRLVNDRVYQRTLFDAVKSFYAETSNRPARNLNPGDLFFEVDTLDNLYYCSYIDSATSDTIFNVGEFEAAKNIRVKRVLPNSNKEIVLVVTEKPGALSDEVYFINLTDDRAIDSLKGVYAVEWYDNKAIVYGQTNRTGRSHQLVYHVIGSRKDSVLLTENDQTFDIDLLRRDSNLMCTVQSKSENEVYLFQKNVKPELLLIQQRQNGVNYDIYESEGQWYKITNDKAPNNRILSANSLTNPLWVESVPNDKHVFIQDLVLTKDYFVIKCYDKSIMSIKYRKKNEKKWTNLDLKMTICESDISAFDASENMLQFSIQSPNSPVVSNVINLKSGSQTSISTSQLKQPWWLSYLETERIWAKTNDGTKIPITLIQSKVQVKEHKGLILKVYGAYGAITNPGFSIMDAVLARHGYTVAYAHVRGEGILGYEWYDDGRLMNKNHSIEDYITCAEFLIKKGYTNSSFLVGYGNSAGGVVAGTAANKRPELFNTVILDHPYLDVLTTMMNDTLPLTADEYKEWGNPNDPETYKYIQSYSPYQNIKEQAYPNFIFIGSYLDQQTPIWQISSSVARIRQLNTSSSNTAFLTDMSSGHAGNTTGQEWIKSFSNTYSLVNMNLFDP